MSNREEFEYEAGQELKLPVSIIKQARMGDGYDHAFDSMSVMQPLSQWWHWWQAGREGMDKKLTDMAVQLANAESKCRELAAENAELNKFITQSCYVFDGEQHEISDAYICATDGGMPETPASDAFLAEVRAQVWIEGSEPAEFGRYWVRYETDVGPQYCSAQWMEYNFCAGSDTNIHKIWLADHSRSINSLRCVTHYTKLPDSLEGAAQ